MSIYSAGFFGLIVIACVSAFKFFYLSTAGYTHKASEYMLEIDISELKQIVITTIAEQKTFTDELAKLTYNVDVATVIARKCRTFKPSKVDDCKYRLRNIFEVITIESTYPSWRGTCEDFHMEALDIYECIRNFRRNSGWTHSKLISSKENAQIEECFKNIPKAEFYQCIN